MTCDYDYDRFDECLSGHGLYQKTEIPATPFGVAGILTFITHIELFC
jgi:hypothetical protein